MSYVLIRSWHLIVGTDRGGAVRTRCGRRVAVEGTITSGGVGELVLHPTAPELPLGDRSCETCLRLSVHDVEPPVIENDEVLG